MTLPEHRKRRPQLTRPRTRHRAGLRAIQILRELYAETNQIGFIGALLSLLELVVSKPSTCTVATGYTHS